MCFESQGRLSKNDFTTETTGFISISTINQYQDDGFKYTRKVDWSKLDGEVEMPSYGLDNPSEQSKVLPSSSNALRITTDGHQYISTTYAFEPNKMNNNEPQSADSYDPIDAHRSLKVIGTDDRQRIYGTNKYPFSVVGALGYYPYNFSCTGTVIYKSAVLTAAHCLYDFKNQSWAPASYFTPGMISYLLFDPFGSWYVESLTIPDGYAETGYAGFDYGVVKLQKNNSYDYDNYIGEVVGYAGLSEVTGFDDPFLDNCTIIGYPGDLSGGSGMWSMGRCPSGFINASQEFTKYGTPPAWMDPNRIAFHDCDTTEGTLFFVA